MAEKEASGSQSKTNPNDDYFMATAFLAAKRNKDPNTQAGACIVNEDGKIVGVGFNELLFPDKEFHAELNAILNKISWDVKNCQMYVTRFPCNECAKIIIQSGIREVIYNKDKHADEQYSKRMFDAAKVKYRLLKPQSNTIEIDFEEIEEVFFSQEKKQKLTNYLDGDDYFMAMAFLAAKQSKDPRTKVGACIVNGDGRIVGVGYNKFPKGGENIFSWHKKEKKPFVCHAELNAILDSSVVKSCKMYVSLFPCNECAKIIIKSGIREVIYKRADKGWTVESKDMLKKANVPVRKYEPPSRTIEINLLSNEVERS